MPRHPVLDALHRFFDSWRGVGFGRCAFESMFPRRQLGSLTLALLNQVAV
jgi:hypothetical protein